MYCTVYNFSIQLVQKILRTPLLHPFIIPLHSTSNSLQPKLVKYTSTHTQFYIVFFLLEKEKKTASEKFKGEKGNGTYILYNAMKTEGDSRERERARARKYGTREIEAGVE